MIFLCQQSYDLLHKFLLHNCEPIRTLLLQELLYCFLIVSSLVGALRFFFLNYDMISHCLYSGYSSLMYARFTYDLLPCYEAYFQVFTEHPVSWPTTSTFFHSSHCCCILRCRPANLKGFLLFYYGACNLL